MRRRYLAGQWAEWIEEQARSGLTIAAFCSLIGVSENSFYVWRRKLRAGVTGQTPGDAMANAAGTSARAAVPFVELTLAGECSGSSAQSRGVEIDLPCGAVVRVPRDAALLEQVLSVLLTSGSGESDATSRPQGRLSSSRRSGGASC